MNHIYILLSISFITLTKIDLQSAIHQFKIAIIGAFILFIIPFIIKKILFFDKLSIIYIIIDMLLLISVLIFGQDINGAKINISLCGVTFQPSEFVKIFFIFFLSSKFSKKINALHKHKYINFVTLITIVHIIILIISKDLGSALIFFVTYIIILYITINDLLYIYVCIIFSCIISFLGFYIFRHVRRRFFAWQNPYILYNGPGYQIVQGIFAISISGFFGLGLHKKFLNKIPFIKQDYMFVAICEQFGSLFAICIILIYINLFILIINISLKLKYLFYKLLSFGIFIECAFQTFLTIGGVVKFIPMTGVTLPLISYGGSSLLCTIIMLSIIQGLYIMQINKKNEK